MEEEKKRRENMEKSTNFRHFSRNSFSESVFGSARIKDITYFTSRKAEMAKFKSAILIAIRPIRNQTVISELSISTA